MQYQNGFDIDFLFEGNSLELSPSTYSFSMIDSIYDIFPTANFTLNDATGVLQEYFFTVEGAKYEVRFGLNDLNITNKYIVKHDDLKEQSSQGFVNGNVNVSLIHEFKDSQEIQSKYYKDKISNIVEAQKGDFTFSKTNIDTTGNNGEWYQLLRTQTDFVNEYLLPFAFSNSASNSPFYYFIDNKNQYNFKNFYSLLTGSQPLKLTLTASTAYGSTNTSIMSVKRLRKGLDITFDLRSRDIFSFDTETGDFLEEEDLITDYPKNNKSLPIVADLSKKTDFFLQEDKDGTVFNKENRQGLVNYSMRNSMTLDRFLIALPFNPDVIAGTPVELVLGSSENNDSDDFNLSGIYLTEKSIHTWDGKSSTATTYAIVGRKSSFIPSGLYKMKGRLI